MGNQITLQLRDEIIARAMELAERSERAVEDVLVEWLDHYADDIPVEMLPDEDVLALCNFELNPMYQHELRGLLQEHKRRDLDRHENTRLNELLQMYRKGIIRKSRAMQVAIERGL